MRFKWFLGYNIVKGMRWVKFEFRYLLKRKGESLKVKVLSVRLGFELLSWAVDRVTVCRVWEVDMIDRGDKRFREFSTIRSGVSGSVVFLGVGYRFFLFFSG